MILDLNQKKICFSVCLFFGYQPIAFGILKYRLELASGSGKVPCLDIHLETWKQVQSGVCVPRRSPISRNIELSMPIVQI